jgi:hypothetical protein
LKEVIRFDDKTAPMTLFEDNVNMERLSTTSFIFTIGCRRGTQESLLMASSTGRVDPAKARLAM